MRNKRVQIKSQPSTASRRKYNLNILCSQRKKGSIFRDTVNHSARPSRKPSQGYVNARRRERYNFGKRRLGQTFRLEWTSSNPKPTRSDRSSHLDPFEAHDLVILGQALRAARSPSFDLAAGKTNNEVRNEALQVLPIVNVNIYPLDDVG